MVSLNNKYYTVKFLPNIEVVPIDREKIFDKPKSSCS